MSDAPPSQSELVLYQTEDGRTRIQRRFEADTVWMTQAQMAELFQTTPQNVTLHLKAIFAEGERQRVRTTYKFRKAGGRCRGSWVGSDEAASNRWSGL